MGGKSAAPPDYSAMAAATERGIATAERLGNRQMDFAQRQYEEMKPLAERVAAQQMAAQEQQMKQAQDYYDYQQKTFRPLEQGLVAQVQQYNTEGNRAQLAAQASADAANAFQSAQGVSNREMARRGINASSGAALMMRNQNALGLAGMTAGAATNARRQAEQTGFARSMDVTGLGRGLAGASLGAYQGANASGSAGLNSAMSAGNQYGSAFGQGAGYMMGGAQMGLTGQGQILGSQTSVYNTAQSQADPFASILGMGLGAYAGGFGGAMGKAAGSDIRLKMNIERVGTDTRTGLPVYEFEYKANPGERFRGVMAHEVEAKYPDAVTTGPDGFKAVFYERLGMEMVRV
jgi:hypothetical protein